ncbi:hypothetical protein FGG79_02710 [Bacillus sp. BHET2]|uniref:hypothetical protein n=1 Tax=Bacillus sp. BHET2 TaxID=2583818 RepID=UPI00110DA151|nr:hypothetical protein [Bacillus sp. BHET2]TMU87067.1 hypothetical protein FGG79_02710 [Bacillus sp. BHET2]
MKKSLLLLLISFILLLAVTGCSEEKWNQSNLFESGPYKMIGVEDRLGFIYDDSEAVRFYPGKVNKYMWHLWGDEEEVNGNLKVVATHQQSKEEVVMFEGNPLDGPHNGADVHTNSLMSLPESGMWRLDAYVEERLHGSVYVEVHEE